MSIALVNKVQKLEAEVEALRLTLRALLDRVKALEADELPVEPRPRGRPPKAVQQ